MPEGRFLSKTVANDWELNGVSFEADYLFTRCVPHLDREGRLPGHPAEVKGTAVPLRPELTVLVVDRCLCELADAGLVEWYQVEGRPCLQFPGFEGNQKGLRKDREAASRIPPPTADGAQKITSLVRDSGSTPDQVRTSSGSTPELTESDDPEGLSSLRRSSGATPAQVEVEVEVQEEVQEQPESSSGNPDSARGDRRPDPAPNDSGSASPQQDPGERLTISGLVTEAGEVLGLGTWGNELDVPHRKAKDIILTWQGAGMTLQEVYAAIHGLRRLVDSGRVSWIEPDEPIRGLEVLVRTRVVVPGPDGEQLRSLFSASVDSYYAESLPLAADAADLIRRATEGVDVEDDRVPRHPQEPQPRRAPRSGPLTGEEFEQRREEQRRRLQAAMEREA